MNVVDSSGWLEYFADGTNAGFFADAIEDTEHLIVPVITIYEVFKRILQQRSEDDALIAVATMSQGIVVELDASVSMVAAKMSHELKLPTADSIILATAQANGATLWTQDADLEGKEGVRYQSKLPGKK
jgi:predicted nucleic acid-binding protein